MKFLGGVVRVVQLYSHVVQRLRSSIVSFSMSGFSAVIHFRVF